MLFYAQPSLVSTSKTRLCPALINRDLGSSFGGHHWKDWTPKRGLWLLVFSWWCGFILWFLVHLLTNWPDCLPPGSWPDKTITRLQAKVETASIQRSQCPVWKQHPKQCFQESHPVSAYCVSLCLVCFLWLCCVRQLSNIPSSWICPGYIYHWVSCWWPLRSIIMV